MIRSLILLTAILGLGSASFAGELDNDPKPSQEQLRAAKDLPATVVVRVDQRTNKVEVMHSSQTLPADVATQAAVAKGSFTAMNLNETQRNELDRNSSSSSWYFWFNNYNYMYPTYFYGGYAYNYVPYYSYYYGPYSYYYYGWGY